MGTTAVAAVVAGGKLIIGNLGDSRAYLISDHFIRQITADHSYVELLLRAGSIGAEEARTCLLYTSGRSAAVPEEKIGLKFRQKHSIV